MEILKGKKLGSFLAISSLITLITVV